MNTRPFTIVVALTRAWVRVYTLGLPAKDARGRREEIESDLWEMRHDPSLNGSWSFVTQALRRLLAGMADDIAWRIEVTPVRELAVTVAAVNGGPTFHIIEARGPRPGSIGAGMLTSMLMFGCFGLMFQPRAIEPTAIEWSAGPGSGAPAAETDLPFDPNVPPLHVTNPRNELVAAVADLLNRHYYDRIVGWQLAMELIEHQANGHYDSARTWPELVDRLDRHIHEAAQVAGVAPGAFVADVVFSEPVLPLLMPVEGARKYRQAFRLHDHVSITIQVKSPPK